MEEKQQDGRARGQSAPAFPGHITTICRVLLVITNLISIWGIAYTLYMVRRARAGPAMGPNRYPDELHGSCPNPRPLRLLLASQNYVNPLPLTSLFAVLC